jgi:aspartyl-tRNA(Asn)/glutamyl-tRNA(Gln) amidotransferase subunit A
VLGPLAGIPIGIKDNVATAGLRTTAGSQILADWIPRQDAAVVGKLREAGGILVGKHNMHEFADGPTNDNPHFGRPLNPWNRSRMSGGSSGGSAVALATGQCLGAVGTDTGGSIRTPAAFCGVVGLKPTYGVVSRAGIVPFSWSLDHAGPMARTVTDAGILLEAIEGHDPADTGSLAVPSLDPLAEIDRGLRGLVFGVETTYFNTWMSPGVGHVFSDALGQIVSLGGEVEEVRLPAMGAALAAELAILFAEAATLHAKNLDDRAEDYGQDVRLSLLSGRMYRAVDYVSAQRVRSRLRRDLRELFDRIDILFTPTVVIEPPEWGAATIPVEGGESRDVLATLVRCLAPFNLSGYPAISIPAGVGDLGLPVAVQLVGRPFAERAIFRAARDLERAFESQMPSPPAV